MLSPEELEEYGWDLLGGAQAVLSAEMLRIILRYYALSCTLSPSDRRRLMELSVSQRREIDAVLARYNPVVGQQAVELTSDLLDTSNARDADRLSEHYHRPASDLSDESRQAAVGVAMIVERDNVSMGDNANRLWYEVSAWTTTEVATGTKSLDEIIAQGVEELLAHGLDSVQYVDSDGNLTVRNKVDVAIRRHAMTQANQAAARMTLEHMEEFGHDLVQTTAHMGARPTHEVWQGRAFSLSGERTIDGVTYPDFYESTGYGTVQGLCGANCRHQFYPHFPGDPLPPRPDTEENNRQYKESQKQRRLEREIRKAKEEAAAYDLAAEQATDPAVADALRKKAEEARLRVGSLQEQMREHVRENDFLVRQPKREKDYIGRARKDLFRASGRRVDGDFEPGTAYQRIESKRDLDNRALRWNGYPEDGIIVKEYTQEEMEDAVTKWTDKATSATIRAYQRGALPDGTSREDIEDVGSLSGRIERYISTSEKYHGEVTRGINVPQDVADSFSRHDIINQLGTSSWTTSEQKSMEYAQDGDGVPVVFRAYTNRGVSIRSLSVKPEEEEVLLSRDTNWIVTNVERDNETGVTYVDCREFHVSGGVL